jgi:hypothetical protein
MSFFSSQYGEAREKFLAAADSAGFRLLRYRLPAEESAELFIDIALLRRDPSKTFLHISGVHGLEGYVGSAIQTAALTEGFKGEGPTLLFVHGLNPYGMAFYRRGNSANVDLNRNFLAKRDPAVNPDYDFFSDYLAPKNWLQMQAGLLKAWFHYFRLGKARAAQAIASGQVRNPSGLFYGGKHLAREILLFQELLKAHCAEAKELLAIDVHSGLGDFGDELLFVDEEELFFAKAFAREVTKPDPENGTYENSGRFSDSIRAALPSTQVRYALQEFGTYSASRVLGALRRENFAWRINKIGSRAHDLAAAKALEAFCPNDASWRAHALEKGLLRIKQALTALS